MDVLLSFIFGLFLGVFLTTPNGKSARVSTENDPLVCRWQEKSYIMREIKEPAHAD